MHGFPLTLSGYQGPMCRSKKGRFASEAAALRFIAKYNKAHPKQKKLVGCYCCPWCCMFHVTSHAHQPRYDAVRDQIIWMLEVESWQDADASTTVNTR
jgi:hypothetical protein